MSVFVVLGLIWAGVLIPPLVRSRTRQRAEFIDSFRSQMGTLGTKAEQPAAGVRRGGGPARRRREVLAGLLTGTAAALVLSLLPALRAAWVGGLFLFDTLLVYVALLVRARDRGRSTSHRAPAAEGLNLPVAVG